MADWRRYGRRGFLAAAGLAVVGRNALAQTPIVRTAVPQPATGGDLIPRSLLFAGPDRSQAKISPDGKLIAFLGPVGGVQNVWMAPVADPAAAKPVTKFADRDLLSEICWPQDSRHVVFFRDQAGDENWQAHRVDVETSQVRPLSPSPGVRSFVQQLSARFPGELLISHNQRDKRFFDVYRVNAATGASTLLYRNEEFAEIFTDPQFKARWGTRYREDGGWDVVNIEPQGGRAAGAIFRSVAAEDAYTTRMIEVSDDGRELYWLDSQGRDTAAVVAQDLASGRMRVLTENVSADFGYPVLDPVRCRPIAAPVVYTRRRWRVLDSSMFADIDRLEASIQGDLGGFSLSNDRTNWVGYTEAMGKPGRFFHYDRRSNRVRPLFSSRPALDKAPLAPMRSFVVTARDELKLVCYLTRPVDAAQDTPGPTVLLVHGGPWGRDMPDFNATHQWLANRGYNVLSVNFRGSTGFGKSFVNAGDLEWARKMHDDLIDAVEWAIGERIADPERIAIYGASYGGYSALVGATFTPTRFACAVDLFGISNLVTFAKAVPPYWGSWAPVLRKRMGDYTTEEGRRFLLSRSPIAHVDRIVRPLLIGQGGNDVRVTPPESEQIVAEMTKRKIPVTYVFYGDEGHGFRRAPNRKSFTAVVEAFLAQHLGGRLEPVGTDFKGSSIAFRAGRELIPSLG